MMHGLFLVKYSSDLVNVCLHKIIVILLILLVDNFYWVFFGHVGYFLIEM